MDVLAGHGSLADGGTAEPVQRADDALDDRLGRRRACREADAPGVDQQFGIDVRAVLDERGGASGPLRRPRPGAASWRSSRSPRRVRRRSRRRARARRPAGSASRSRCRWRLVRAAPGTALARRRRWRLSRRSRAWSASGRRPVRDRRSAARPLPRSWRSRASPRAPRRRSLRFPRVPDGRPARRRNQPAAKRRASAWTLETSGQVASITSRPALGSRGSHRRRDAVRREDDRLARRDLVDVVDEDRSALLEVGDHVRVVDDLLAHVDRSAASLQRALDDLDRPDDAGARRTRGREHDLARAERARPVLDQRGGAAQRAIRDGRSGHRPQRVVQLLTVGIEHHPQRHERLALGSPARAMPTPCRRRAIRFAAARAGARARRAAGWRRSGRRAREARRGAGRRRGRTGRDRSWSRLGRAARSRARCRPARARGAARRRNRRSGRRLPPAPWRREPPAAGPSRCAARAPTERRLARRRASTDRGARDRERHRLRSRVRHPTTTAAARRDLALGPSPVRRPRPSARCAPRPPSSPASRCRSMPRPGQALGSRSAFRGEVAGLRGPRGTSRHARASRRRSRRPRRALRARARRVPAGSCSRSSSTVCSSSASAADSEIARN